MQQFYFRYKTSGRGLYNITQTISQFVSETQTQTGLCHLFLQHTSASLTISENADPAVLNDLENFMHRIIPDDNSLYTHTEEGADDMPSHIRNVLTQSFLTLPICKGNLALGRWQGIYLWEHRFDSHKRNIIVTIY